LQRAARCRPRSKGSMPPTGTGPGCWTTNWGIG
jgi:hypothetical protein